MNGEKNIIIKILSRIKKNVTFKYPGDEGEKNGILEDRVVIPSNNEKKRVPYWDVVDLISFPKEKEKNWIRIGYYRMPGDRLVWGSQTTITEPIKVWKRILIETARQKKWFRNL